MSAALRAWLAWHRARRAAARLRPRPPREQLVRELAPGRSFLDVGAMWNVHGAIAFAAEQAGATRVTTVDLMGETAEFRAEHARRGSRVRHVTGDLHDPAVLHEAGRHDVVWCSGVLYHAPNPLLTLERLRTVTGELLLLATEALPELPLGPRGATVLYPALGERDRAALSKITGGPALGLTSPYEPGQGYGAWYWGITPSALRGLLAVAGFDVERVTGGPFHLTAIARPAPERRCATG